MKTKKLLCMLLACVAVVGCLPVSASAAVPFKKTFIKQENMEWEWIDLSAVECLSNDIIPQTKASATGSYPANSIRTVIQSIELKVNDIVTFDCSYSPLASSMDFGVVSSAGRFYYINVKEGSINQGIRISQAGTYYVAIRNNSSQTVRVVGFVDY